MNIIKSLAVPILLSVFTTQIAAETLYNRLVRDYRIDSTELGVRAGSMRLDPALTLDVTQNSNVLATSDSEESDTITSLRPALRLRNLESPHLIQLIAGAEIANHADFSDEDYEDVMLAFNGDWELGSSNRLGLILAYEAGHEDRTKAEERNGIEPTDVDESRAELIYRGNRGWASYGLTVRHQGYDFGSTTLADTTVLDNDDRDFDTLYTAIDAGLSDERIIAPYLRVGKKDINYDEFNGLDRSSDSSFAHIGFRTSRKSVLSSDIYLGYAWNKFDDNRFEDFNDVVFGGNLSWWPSRRTNITGLLGKEVNGTTIAGAAGTETTKLELGLNHELKRYIDLTINLGYGNDDYVNLDRKDKDLYGMIEISRDLGRKLRIGAAYSHNERNVTPDILDTEYAQDLFTLFIRGRL